MGRLLLVTTVMVTLSFRSHGQGIKFLPLADTSATLKLEGYIDTYFNYDYAEPQDSNIPYFVSQNRHNEFNINLAYLSLKYSSARVRATFTPGFGTYMNSNYAAERLTLRNIVEANVGVKIFQNKNIWVDVGVIGSPFTNESAISFDQPTLTRSFAPEYVPYYLTGARLSLPMGKKFTTNLYLINGWQVIEDVNTPLAFAGQLEFKPTERLTLNMNTYYGYEKSPSAPNNRIRTFLDFYSIYKVGKFNVTLSSYVGNQQRQDSLRMTNNVWWQVNSTVRYYFTSKHSVSLRGEYFSDPNSVMIVPTTGVKGFASASYSVGYNIEITPAVLFRMEARYFQSPKQVFTYGSYTSDQHTTLTGGLTIKF